MWGEITKLKPISASEGDSCVIVLNWGCLWVLSALQHQLQRLHCPSMTSICIYINMYVCRVRQTQEDGPAQSSLCSPDPSELACSILTLGHCLRLGGFGGPAELIAEVVVQVLRQ